MKEWFEKIILPKGKNTKTFIGGTRRVKDDWFTKMCEQAIIDRNKGDSSNIKIYLKDWIMIDDPFDDDLELVEDE